MNTLKKALLITGLCLVSAAPCLAVTDDGAVGATSTGHADITLTLPELIQVSDIDELRPLAAYAGSGTFDEFDDVCVYSNMTSGGSADYTVKVTGGNPPGPTTPAGFSVGNLTTDQAIDFTVAWNDEDGTNVGEQGLTHDTEQGGFVGWSNEVGCGDMGGVNARFHVVMAENDILAVKAGTYTNTITILLTPSPT